MPKILLVEDDKMLREHVRDALVFEQHVVEAVDDGGVAWEYLQTYTFDLVILDWDLPTLTGYDVLQRLRANGIMSPVLFLTGKANWQDKEKGLDAGADDYLTKPFHLKELSARVRALMRRPELFQTDKLVCGDITLDTIGHRVYRDGQEVHLQPREFALLEYLMRRAGQIFSPKALVDAIWPAESEVTDDIVRAYVKNIRRKISLDGKNCIIKTVHGVGYKAEG